MIKVCPFKQPNKINVETGEITKPHKKLCNYGKGTWCSSCSHFRQSKVAMEKHLKHMELMKKEKVTLPKIWAKNKAGIKRTFEINDFLNLR